MSNCHIQFGRRNEMADPVTMMKWLRDSAVPVEKAKKMTPEELEGKFTIGILSDVEKPVYTEEYKKIRERAMAFPEESES
jgi:2-oxoglutarate ferredoxin oxidoreductase subunit beta